MTRSERLRTYRISKGYSTSKEFAEFLGISPSQISEINKKKNPAVLLLALERKTDLNLQWLETGEGDMLREQNEPPKDDLLRLVEEEFGKLLAMAKDDTERLELSSDLYRFLAEQRKKLNHPKR